jgi:general secretion pathway protein G
LRFRALSVLALLVVAGACERYDAERDATLRQNVAGIRKAITNFRQDTGRYPYTLEELVPKYMREIPEDPFTNSTTAWRLTMEETVQPSSDFQTDTAAAPRPGIVDVHSTAQGADRNGVLYSNY